MKYMTEKQYSEELKKIRLKNKQIELHNKLKAEKNKVRRFSFPKVKTSNKVLMVAIMAVLLFSIACLYIQYETGMEVSSTLITLWYSFWTVEIVSLAGIKVTKVLKDNKLSEYSDNEEDVDFDLETFEYFDDSNAVG